MRLNLIEETTLVGRFPSESVCPSRITMSESVFDVNCKTLLVFIDKVPESSLETCSLDNLVQGYFYAECF